MFKLIFFFQKIIFLKSFMRYYMNPLFLHALNDRDIYNHINILK